MRTTAILLTLCLAAACAPAQEPAPAATPEAPSAIKVQHMLGFGGVPRNAKGTITVDGEKLYFTGNNGVKAELAVGTISNVETADDSRRLIGGTVGFLSMFAPYGSGRFLSLFRREIDVLTIEYRDANGGLHGAIFTMGNNLAQPLKQRLVAAGAKVEEEQPAAAPQPAAAEASEPAPAAKPKTASQTVTDPPSERIKAPKIHASSVRILRPSSPEVRLPDDFRMAIYEQVIANLQKDGKLKVYRDGEKVPPEASDLVELHIEVWGFKEGSARMRQVTTVIGETRINVRLRATHHASHGHHKELMHRNVMGNVKYFGENIRATGDLAKAISKLVKKSFVPKSAGSSAD